MCVLSSHLCLQVLKVIYIYTSHLPHACYMSWLFHLLLFNYCNVIWQRVKIQNISLWNFLHPPATSS
jgi:hypothetical protein